jgi:hypothetical protein
MREVPVIEGVGRVPKFLADTEAKSGLRWKTIEAVRALSGQF